MLEVVRDERCSNSFPAAAGLGKQPNPSTTPAFILLGTSGFSKLLNRNWTAGEAVIGHDRGSV